MGSDLRFPHLDGFVLIRPHPVLNIDPFILVGDVLSGNKTSPMIPLAARLSRYEF